MLASPGAGGASAGAGFAAGAGAGAGVGVGAASKPYSSFFGFFFFWKVENQVLISRPIRDSPTFT